MYQEHYSLEFYEQFDEISFNLLPRMSMYTDAKTVVRKAYGN